MNSGLARFATTVLCRRRVWTAVIIMLLAGTLASGAVLPVRVQGQTTGLTIDGSTQAFCGHNTNSCSATLTNQHMNDIVIVYPIEALDLQTACTFTISDTAGLSWTARSGVVFDQSGRWQLQEFWAKTTGLLTGDSITESILGCASSEYGGEYNGFMAFGISGGVLSSPFDPSTALPANATGTSGNTLVQVSTANPNDMIIGAALHGDPCCSLSNGPGFTIITSGPGVVMATEYENVNSPVNRFPVTFNDTASAGWISIGDAVQGSTAPDFYLSASPGSLTVAAGGSGSSTVTLTSFNGFSGTVSLATTEPAGISASISPATIMGQETATLNVAASVNGTFTVQVTGTSGSLSHTVTVTVTVSKGGIVCLVSTDSTSCPSDPAALMAPVGSQLKVSVFAQASPGLNGFDIILLADHTILAPAGVDLTGSVLLGTPSVVAECLGIRPVQGPCNSADTANTLELAATSAFGSPLTPSPTTGLLFTAIYNVTGVASNINLGFQTGCGTSSAPTSDPTFCLTVTNGSPSPVPELSLGAIFSEGQTLTASFNGLTFQIRSSLAFQNSTKTLSGTIQVTATNTTGQVAYTHTYNMNIPVAPQTTRFVLVVIGTHDGIICSTSTPNTSIIQCYATYNPDVYNQGAINIIDVSALALAYGSSPNMPHWNPYFDFDLSGSIGIQDVSVVFLNYGVPLIT